MLTTIKPMLKKALSAAGLATVYTDMEDESKIKGLKYGWVFVADPERVIRDGETIVVSGDQYYLREYELRLKLGVHVAARDEADAGAIKNLFLNALALTPTVKDPQGFDIEVAALTAEFIGDKSILKTGCGYEIVIEFYGGVYRPADPASIDPWLKVLSEWTTTTLGAPWRSYEFYPVGRPDMTLYWKVSSVDLEDNGLAAFTVRKKMTAHIFARDDLTTWAALKIAEALQAAYKIPLDAPQKKFLTVHKPEANLRNGPNGQVTVTLTRNTKRPTEDAPLIQRFSPSGTLQEG